MTSKSWCNPVERLQTNKPARGVRMFCKSVKGLLFTFICLVAGGSALAGDAPAWMHAAAVAPLPAHDEKTDAVIIYSEDITTVLSERRVKTLQRRAYKILRPGGKEYGRAIGEFDSNSRISGMRAWCIPVQGKDYEIKDKDAIEVSPAGVEEMVMATDAKYRVLKIQRQSQGTSLVMKSRENRSLTFCKTGGIFRSAYRPGKPDIRCSCRKDGSTRRSGSITRMFSQRLLGQISGNGS